MNTDSAMNFVPRQLSRREFFVAGITVLGLPALEVTAFEIERYRRLPFRICFERAGNLRVLFWRSSGSRDFFRLGSSVNHRNVQEDGRKTRIFIAERCRTGRERSGYETQDYRIVC